MRLMLNEVSKGRLALPEYVRMTCEAPVRAFGLYPRKVSLQPGSDADIVVVDLAKSAVIRVTELQSIGNVTPFECRQTIGEPVMTILLGTVVARDGFIVAKPGTGQPVVRIDDRQA